MDDVKKLDTAREVVIQIDSSRSITLTPTTTGESVVVAVEDPHSVALVEVEGAFVDQIVAALKEFGHG